MEPSESSIKAPVELSTEDKLNILKNSQDELSAMIVKTNENLGTFMEKIDATLKDYAAAMDAKIERRFSGMSQIAAETGGKKSGGTLGMVLDIVRDPQQLSNLKELGRTFGIGTGPGEDPMMLKFNMRELIDDSFVRESTTRMKKAIRAAWNLPPPSVAPSHVNIEEVNHGTRY